MFTKALIVATVLCTMCIFYTGACSCRPMHPQEHYCKSDFVILARVNRKVHKNDTITYKVRVKQEYKMTEKALVALKSGKIHTANESSLCGVTNLYLKDTYVISGRILSLRAYINSCNMIVPRKRITRRQKKGLKLMYKNGCTCSIQNCVLGRCGRTADACNWLHYSRCHSDEGICLRDKHNQCMWRTTQTLRKCIRENSHHFLMVRVESLLDKRKAVLPQTPLYLDHMPKDPRLVLEKNT